MRINSNIVSFGNGNSISIGGGNINISQKNGRTYVNGRDITDLAVEESSAGILQIVIEEGTLVSLESDVAVEAGNVSGNVHAGNGVKCGDVQGNVSAGNSITCGNISGSAKAGNSINHR